MSNIFQRYGKLTFLAELGAANGRTQWSCRCDCGELVIASARNVKSGVTTSCGCARQKHGMSKTHPLYATWLTMRDRCNNPKHKDYGRYGGRGIKVDPRWDDFAQFVADMGERPKGKSIDRIDNDGDYSAENCRWATQKEQVTNSSKVQMLTANGKTQSQSDWARELGVHQSCISQRINQYGWSIEKACTTPGRTSGIRKPPCAKNATTTSGSSS